MTNEQISYYNMTVQVENQQETYKDVVQTTIVDVDGQKIVKEDQPLEKSGSVAVFIGVMLSVITLVAMGLAVR